MSFYLVVLRYFCFFILKRYSIQPIGDKMRGPLNVDCYLLFNVFRLDIYISCFSTANLKWLEASVYYDSLNYITSMSTVSQFFQRCEFRTLLFIVGCTDSHFHKQRDVGKPFTQLVPIRQSLRLQFNFTSYQCAIDQ